jgi:hypothetical protein
MIEFGINSTINISTNKSSFEILYGYIPHILPPIIYDDHNPAAIYFVETRMLNLLETQDIIITAKTDQAHSANKSRKDPSVNPMKTDDYILCLLEWAGSKDDKPAKKLRQRWIGPYLVTTHDPSYIIYRLDLGDQHRYNSFHVSKLKLYTGEPTVPQRRPRISPTVEADNLEVDKILSHNITYSGKVQFLCQWKDYLPEDATYRLADDIRRPDARILVAKYLSQLSPQALTDNLKAWMDVTPWSRQTVKSAPTTATPASVLAAYIPATLGHWSQAHHGDGNGFGQRHGPGKEEGLGAVDDEEDEELGYMKKEDLGYANEGLESLEEEEGVELF